MSSSKKKRMGSRRSLNQNAQETHEEGGTANSPPLPQRRPRADAKADLTLSPDSAQFEMPGRKKKLGSQRGNKGKQPFMEFTIESTHEPTEEMEDTTTYPPAPVSDQMDILSFKSESLDKSLEETATSVARGSEMVGFQISDESLNAGISTETETFASKSQKSDIEGTGVDYKSDGPSEKYLPEINRAQEGVLSEKDQAKQMPEILKVTLPVGVTEETTCTVKLIEQEEISITGSHDKNKNTEDKVGQNLEKPDWQETEKSSLPIASIRKLGSSRRKKERRHETLQDQHEETAVETNAFNVLETTEFINVQNSSKEVSVDFNDLATGVTYKEEGQLEVHSSPKMGLDQINKDDNLSEVVKTNLFGQEDQEEEAKLSDEHPGDLQKKRPIEAGEDLFSVQIPHTDNTNAPVASPYPDVTVSVEDVTATGSQLIGNRRKLGSSRKTKDRRQVNDESKQDVTSGEIITPNQTIETIKTEFMIEKQSPETALDYDIFGEKAARQKVAESFIQQVHDETLETAEDTIATDKSSKMSETTALFMDVVQEQTVKSDISEIDGDIFDMWLTESNTTEMSFHQPDTHHFGRLEEDTTLRQASQESSTKPTEVDFVTQSEISTSPKEQVKVNQITLSDNEMNEETDNLLTTDQTHHDQVEETKIFVTDFENLTQKGDKSSVQQVHNESSHESDEKIEDITTDKSLKNTGIEITPSSTAVVQEPAVKSNTSPKEDIVNFDYGYFAADAEHKERNEKDLKEDQSLDGSHLLSETLELEAQLEKSFVTEVISSKEELVTELSEPMFDVLPGIQPSREKQLHLDQSEDYNLLNFTTAPPSEGALNKNEVVVAQPENVHQITSSSERVSHDDRDNSSVESTEQEETNDKPHESAKGVSTFGDINKNKDQEEEVKQEVKLSDDQPVDLQKEQPFEAGEDLSFVQIIHTDDTNAALVSPQPGVTATDSQLIGNRKKLGSSRRTKERRQVTDESKQDKKSEEITPDKNIEEKQTQPLLVEWSLETEFKEQVAGQEAVAESFIQSHNETMEKVEVIITSTDKSPNTSEMTALFKEVVQEQTIDGNTSKKVDSDIFDEWAGDQSKTTETSYQPPDNVIFGRLAEDTTLRQKSSTEKSGITEQGEPESITQSEIYLPLKQLNAHQIFFLSDNEDMDSSLKQADDTTNNEDDNQSIIKQSTEQLVHEEVIGEPAETVQTLDIEVNELNPDPHLSPMRRKLGSSRRSKGSKQEVTTTDNKGISFTENKDFLQLNPAEEMPQQEPYSLDVTIDGQTELSKQEVNVKVEDTEVTTMKENSSLEKQDLQALSSSPKEMDLDQLKAYDLSEADKTNLFRLEETEAQDFEIETRKRDVFSLTSPGEVYKDEDQEEDVKLKDEQPASLQKEEPSELSSEQIPHIDDTDAPNPAVMVNVEEDVTATGSRLTGNRRKLGSSRTKERRQVNDESKQWEIDITPDDLIQIEPVLVEQSPETAADSDIFHGKAPGQEEVDESSIQPVQDVSAESDEGKITTEKSLKTTEITTFYKEVVQEQIVDGDTDDNDLSNITETSKQQRDNTTLETPAEDTTIKQELSTEARDFTEQPEVESETYLLLKEPLNVHQLTFLSDNESHEERENWPLQQTEQPGHKETIGKPSEIEQLLHKEENEPDAAPHRGPGRRKMGSSRRSKGRKQEVTTTDNEDIFSIKDKDAGKVTELMSSAEEMPQQEPYSLDVTIDGQTELSKQEVTVKVEDTEVTTMKENSSLEKQDLRALSSSPKEEMDLDQLKAYGLSEADKTNLFRLEETEAQDFEIETRKRDVFSLTSPGEVYKDEDQEEDVKLKDEQLASLQKEEPSELSSEQIPHIDDTDAPNPAVMVNVEEDVTATGSRLTGNRRKLGSSRRTKERRQVNDESKQWEIDITPDDLIQIEPVLVEQSPETAADSDIFHGKAPGQEEVDESSIQPVQDVSAVSDEGKITTEKSLKTTEITTFFKEVAQEQNVDGDTDDNDLSNITETSKQQRDNTTLETPAEDTTIKQESSTEARDFIEQPEVESETYLSLKEPLNVHQLTFLSDSESHEDMENWPLQQTEQPGHKETIGKPSEIEQLLHKEENEPDAAPHRGPSRRKMGSSRRTKGRKQEVTTTDNEDIFSIEDKDAGKVTELMSSAEVPQKELQRDDLEQKKNIKPEDIAGAKAQENSTDIKIQVVSHEDKPLKEVIQMQSTIMEVDSFTIKDLKEQGITGAEVSPRDADIDTDNIRSQNESTAESEETVRAELFDASQTVVMSAEDVAKDQQAVQHMEVLETGAELQIKPEPKRRKMGSTRKSQLNKKQQDEERNAEDNAAISEKTTVEDEIQALVTEDKETKPLSSDIFVKQEEVTIAASPVTDEQQSEEGRGRPEFAQEGKKGEVLQTEEVTLVVEMAAGTTTQNVHPDTGEEIQPSSPGKRRKMGSTRKNLRSKRESPQADKEEIVTAVNVENEAIVKVSNENVESKENSGLLVHRATVHQQPDEETPLSQQNNQENLSSESVAKEAEMFSKPDAMTDEAIVARRRKMGSHRKPHTDQSIRQGRLPDNQSAINERALQPLAEESSKLSEVNVGDNRVFSTPLSIKAEPKPVSERPSQHQPLPSTNVRLAQESPMRLSAGAGNKASLNASKYEVVMIGDSSVGKTSFMKRAQSGKFSSDLPASVGMDSYMWTVDVGEKTVVLHLWDTAGQERFHSMTKQIFHRAQAFLLMYDISCSQSFTAVSYWANCIKEGASENVVILLLGNKSDCTDRKVQRDDGEILAQEKNFAFMECSAATGENVVEALETVARLLSEKAARREEPLVLRKPEPRNKFGCC